MTRTLTGLLVLVLSLTVSGCSADEDGSGAGPTPAASPEATSAPPRIALERVDIPDPAAPPELVLTYNGRRPGRFSVLLTPPDLGGVDPGAVELEPGGRERLTVLGLRPDARATVRVIDLRSGDEVATIDLP